MLREVLEDAIERGEKIKKDIVRELLSSTALADLLHSKRFLETVTRILNSKKEVSRLIRRHVRDVLKVMSIASKGELQSCEKRMHELERRVDQLSRHSKKKKSRRR
ncbi:MAG: hypothetical protein Q7S98_03160 [Deltaproteobacteria bacterium]|nr:hypothetical protein [Deltaproteobacteria bacterium]